MRVDIVGPMTMLVSSDFRGVVVRAHIIRNKKLLYANVRFSSSVPDESISFTRPSIWSYTPYTMIRISLGANLIWDLPRGDLAFRMLGVAVPPCFHFEGP